VIGGEMARMKERLTASEALSPSADRGQTV